MSVTERRPARGLSLLEVLVSLFLLLVMAGAIITLYTGAVAGTNKAEGNQEALARLDTLVSLFQERARTGDLNTLAVAQGDIDGYLYRVDDLGTPAVASVPDSNGWGTPLSVRQLRITLEYVDRNPASHGARRQLEVKLLVGQ